MPDEAVAAANSAFDRAVGAKPKELAKFAKEIAKDWPLPSREEWNDMSLDDCHALIQRIQASYQEGATILNQRVYTAQRESGTFVCLVCRKKKPQAIDNHPNYVWRRDDRHPQTGVLTSNFICSSECFHRGSNSGKLTNAKVAADVHK